MNSNYYGNRSCGGFQQVNNFCAPTNNGNNGCLALGPFTAVDTACLVDQPVTGSVVPFSSGIVPVVLTSLVGGLIGTVSLVGFGTSIIGVALVGTTIPLPLLNEAFTVPRAGTITSIAATLSNVTVDVAIVGTATVNATIYRAPAGSDVFEATAASVDLTPSLTGIVGVGTILAGTATSSVPVSPGDRLVMVFSVSGGTVAVAVTGNASAGITID